MELRQLSYEPEVSDLLNKPNRWLIVGPFETSLHDYLKLLNKQAAKCAICDATDSHGKRLQVDRDHNSTNLRGLLCQNCNCGLGHFRDSRDSLLRANQYLKGNLKTFNCNSLYSELITKSGYRLPKFHEIKQRFLQEQGDKCIICMKLEVDIKTMCLDHCHKTNKIRGVICDLCNHGLGQFKDNSVLLLRANLYLKKHQKST